MGKCDAETWKGKQEIEPDEKLRQEAPEDTTSRKKDERAGKRQISQTQNEHGGKPIKNAYLPASRRIKNLMIDTVARANNRRKKENAAENMKKCHRRNGKQYQRKEPNGLKATRN